MNNETTVITETALETTMDNALSTMEHAKTSNSLKKTVALATASSLAAFAVLAFVAIKRKKRKAAKAEIDGEETNATIE